MGVWAGLADGVIDKVGDEDEDEKQLSGGERGRIGSVAYQFARYRRERNVA